MNGRSCMSTELTTVQAWQDAANQHDIDRLLALSGPEIALIGPRGRGSGHQLLHEWVARAGLLLTTQRIFQRGDTIVLAQHALWESSAADGGASEANLATRYRIRDQQVVEVERYDDLASALAAARLSEADEHTNMTP